MIYQFRQNIYFTKEDSDISHFNWLFRAISLVGKKYLNYMISYGSEKEKQFHMERVFAYELYRQWANILESECNEPLVLNAELDKIIAEPIQLGDDEGDAKMEEIRKYPDLVLHNDQGNDNKQKIICEIKRNTDTQLSGSAIFADLYKLTCYMDKEKFCTGNDPFDYGVFILLNGNLEQIKDIKKSKIKVGENDYRYSRFKKEMSKHFKELVCVTYNGTILEFQTLKSILKIK